MALLQVAIQDPGAFVLPWLPGWPGVSGEPRTPRGRSFLLLERREPPNHREAGRRHQLCQREKGTGLVGPELALHGHAGPSNWQDGEKIEPSFALSFLIVPGTSLLKAIFKIERK